MILNLLRKKKRRFNTSHVVVYLLVTFSKQVYNLVSIHLMLQFILVNFCTFIFIKVVSIHLMLQFIDVNSLYPSMMSRFQYISCCSLSNFAKKSYIIVKGFNTSHVVVYRMCRVERKRKLDCFNTSHVVVYLIHCLVNYVNKKCFNTSHVVVYRKQIPHWETVFLVSIHLMLQFIENELAELKKAPSFNTSHVVVYPMLLPHFLKCFMVSIHLMLQFIQQWI